MKERPILFSTPMVRVILNGRKTQTRRIVKSQPPAGVTDIIRVCKDFVSAYPNRKAIKPFEYSIASKWDPGDILWVRETWRKHDMNGALFFGTEYDYKAGYVKDADKVKWKSPRFMPKAASRIKLEITNIRVERLQDISEEDAKAEGVYFYGWDDYHQTDYKNYSYNDKGMCDDWGVQTAKESYETLWESINGKGSWGKNPFVWVIKFKRL